jgi:ketosteroid isomerase-like protein
MDMRKVTVGLLGLACIAVLALNGFGQQSSVADDVIAMVRAQWAAEIKDPTNVAEQMKNIADDYTEFNGDYATRLEGKSLNMRLAEASGGSSVRTVAGDMANAKVQVYNGDVAILSYNYVGLLKDKDGKTEPSRAKSTRVYVKQNGKWMMVHANFGADPLPR